jgi:hypothetical protein
MVAALGRITGAGGRMQPRRLELPGDPASVGYPWGRNVPEAARGWVVNCRRFGLFQAPLVDQPEQEMCNLPSPAS